MSAATDRSLGLPIATIDGAFSYGVLIDRACDGADKLLSSTTLCALLQVAIADDTGACWFVVVVVLVVVAAVAVVVVVVVVVVKSKGHTVYLVALSEGT